ncbi:hypothetical protein DAEQUDRAFT_734747 [Daedalea quercina L-15889]|uniref:Uncharacterized protein n=1 Tax=Daedalea quercina L-15889 TaxID=1314783 RepID=A0A165U5Y6_9APHY|nr:hypothetical protein DAEQUDRAFT_734747 [Daedalea quercina L-15889]
MLAAPMKERLHADPCMIARLPTSAFIKREAETLAPQAVLKELSRSRTPSPSPPSSVEESTTPRSSPGPSTEPEATEEPEQPRSRAKSFTSVLSSLSLPSPIASLRRRSYTPQSNTQRPTEPYEVFAAIERKDVMFLMEVRDKAFPLLVRRHGGTTPLVHAMRCGKSHQDVSIVILGAFSRYINHLSDEDYDLPATKTLLKELRLNLRAAIDMGLQLQQSDLIASFLQTLVMSEGERWVREETASIAAALRLGAQGKPVKTAEDAVRGFATKELGKAGTIWSYEDYVANATGDLVMMGAWQSAVDAGVPAEHIPVRLQILLRSVICILMTWYFARDDRVYSALMERLDQYPKEISQRCPRRLRWQFRVLRKVMEGRSTSYPQKVVLLTEEFDHSDRIWSTYPTL